MTASRNGANGRIAFLFTGGRRARVEANLSRPGEFFYGFNELRDAGLSVTLLEEEDFGEEPSPPRLRRSLRGFVYRATGVNPAGVARFARPHVLEQLNCFEVLVATTNSQATSLAVLRAQGLLRARVLAIPMGILPLGVPRLHAMVLGWLLHRIALAPISQMEELSLVDRLGKGLDTEYMPFGVDHRFWVPSPSGERHGDYVLSIGNDWRRDYQTLADAWRSDYPPLKIVTGLPVPESEGQVEVIAGDWKRRLLSDEEIRALFQGARFVVLPIRQTIQPSGQSVCLQAMACGKAVVLSDIQGLWDRDAMRDGEVCLLTPPGSVNELRNRVETLLADPARATEIGGHARRMVEKGFTVDIMAGAMRKRLESMH